MSDGTFPGLSADDLRATVRAVLRDVLPAAVTDARLRAGEASASIEQVSLRDDGDLDSFVRRLAALCEEPAQRAALREGRRRFRLVPAADSGSAPAREATPVGVVRVDRGAVTERRVNQAAADGARLVLGPKAVLTPLARDRARTLGVVVERER